MGYLGVEGAENTSRKSFCVWEKKKKAFISCERVTNCYPNWLIFGGSVTLIHFSDMFFFFLPGFYCLGGSAYPEPCDAGSYCDQTGLEVPAGRCAAGYYCPRGSSEAHATPCPRGHYCPLGTLLPLPCPPGTIKSQPFFLCYWQFNYIVIIRRRWQGRIIFPSPKSCIRPEMNLGSPLKLSDAQHPAGAYE